MAYRAPELTRIAKSNIIVVVTRALFLKIKKLVPNATATNKVDSKTFKYRNARILYRNMKKTSKIANNTNTTKRARLKILPCFLERCDLFFGIVNSYVHYLTHYSIKELTFK